MLHEQNYVFTDLQNVQASRLTIEADKETFRLQATPTGCPPSEEGR